MKKILMLFCLLALSSCMTHDPEDAIRILEDAGYTEITLTGYRMTGCGEDDNMHTGFTAKGPTGRPVSGVLCGDYKLFGKSNTIRID